MRWPWRSLLGLLLVSSVVSAQPPSARARPLDSSLDSSAVWMAQLDSLLRTNDVGDSVVARRLMAHVDSLGIPARWLRVSMHARLAQQWSIGDTLDEHYAMQREAAARDEDAAILRILAEPPAAQDSVSYRTERDTWSDVVRQLQYLHRDSIPFIERTAVVALRRYGALFTAHDQRTLWGENDPQTTWDHLTPAERTHFDNWHPPFYRIRRVWRAPRLTAEAWYLPPGRPANDTIRPVPGKVNLICLTGEQRGGLGDESPDGYDAALLARELRYWLGRYGTYHLELTIVWPAGVHSLFATPPWGQHATVADAVWYWQVVEGLPVTVAVQSPRLDTVLDPHGTRRTIRRLQFNAFWAHDSEVVRRWADGEQNEWVLRPGERPGQCAIVGADGTLEHTSIQTDYLVNTRWALRLLMEGPGAPPRPTASVLPLPNPTP